MKSSRRLRSRRAAALHDARVAVANGRTSSNHLWRLGGAIALLALVVYLPSLGNDFVNWDDPGYVVRNPHLDKFDSHFLLWSLTTFRQANWHPLTWLSLGVDRALFGRAPLGYHLTNLLLHGLTTLFVVLLVGNLFTKALRPNQGDAVLAAGLAGALFAVHPMHVESVVWISERKDLLCGLFYVISLLAYFRFVERQTSLWYLASLSTFALALLSKPMAVSLPFVLLILDVYPLARQSRGTWARLLVEKVPFIFFALASSIMTLIAQSRGGAMVAIRQLGLGTRLWNAVASLGFYLAKLVLPISLVPFYPLDPEISARQWGGVISLVLVLAVVAVAVAKGRSRPQIGALLAAYFVMLLPVLGIVQVGHQAAADRYMYLPMLAPAIAIAAIFLRVWHGGRSRRAVGMAAALITVAGLSALSIRQTGVWRDSSTLWSWVIEKQPDLAFAHHNLGEHLRSKGDLEGAGKRWRRAAELDPSFSWPLNQLGNLAMLQGKTDEAKRYFEQAIRVNARDAEAHLNYAELLDDEGRTEEARRHYEVFLRVAPPDLAHFFPEVRSRLALPAPPLVQTPMGGAP